MSKQQLIHGIHAVDAALTKHPERVLRICMLDTRDDHRLQKIRTLARKQNIPVDYASKHELDRMARDVPHQGVVAFCEQAKTYSEADLEELLTNLTPPAFLLILDGVQDPHNLGACLRSADAAGVHAVIVPRDKAVGLTGTVSKVASGAAESIPLIQVTNLARTLRFLQEQGIWLFGAAEEAEKNLFAADLKGPVGIVLGAEGAGLRRLTREHCDELLKIPMHGIVSSLNVSVATGIFLFEVVRQRG